MLFLEIAQMDAGALLDLKFLGFGFFSSLACILLIWAGARLFLKDKSMVGSFVQGSYRGSAALLGVALMQNIYGSAAYAPVMILSVAPLYNIMAVIILMLEGEREGQEGKKHQAKQALIGVLKNPILWGILLGLPFAGTGYHISPGDHGFAGERGGVGDAPCAAGNWGQLPDRCCKKLPETRFDSDISQAGRAGGGVPAPCDMAGISGAAAGGNSCDVRLAHCGGFLYHVCQPG